MYDLAADAYNRLVYRRDNSSTPCALVLCCLPRDESTWLDVCEDELKIKKCCYYHFIEGTESGNSQTKRIRIPRSQLLTPDSLASLKTSIFAGELA